MKYLHKSVSAGYLLFFCLSVFYSPIWFSQLEAASFTPLNENSEIVFQQAQGIFTESKFSESQLPKINYSSRTPQFYNLKIQNLLPYMKIKTYTVHNRMLHFNLPIICYKIPVAEYTCDG